MIAGRGPSGNWEDDEEARRRTRESSAMLERDDKLDE